MIRMYSVDFLDSCVELYRYLLFCMGILFVCYGQDKAIKVKFRYEGREVNADEIELFLVFYSERGKEVIRPTMVDGKFAFPQVCLGRKVYIVVRYRKRYMYISESFHSTQNMVWKIGFNKKPYDEEYFLEDLERRRDVRAVMYMIYESEKACGVVQEMMISNVRRFYRESRRLLR